MKFTRTMILTFTVAFIFTIVLSFFLCYDKLYNKAFDSLGNISDFNSGWYTKEISDTQSVTISDVYFGTNSDNTLTVYHSVPIMPEQQSRTLALHVDNMAFELYVDNDFIYGYGAELSNFPLYKSPGSNWHFINIPPKYSGGTLHIDLHGFYKDGSEGISEAYFGDSAIILAKLIKSSALCFLVCIILALIGILYMLMHIFFTKLLKIHTALIYIGMFLFSAALYSTSHLPTPTLFIRNPHIISIFSSLIITILPISLLAAVEQTCTIQYKHAYHLGYIILFANFIIQLTLSFLGIYDFHEMIVATRLCILYPVICIIYTVFKAKQNSESEEQEKQFETTLLFYCICLFFIACFADIANHYIYHETDITHFSRLGLIFIAAAWGIISIRMASSYSKRMYVSDMIRKMAYTDQLTLLGNRTAFEKALDDTELNKSKNESVAIIVFDVNSLKYVNDNFGHQQGDILINAAADAISVTFTEGFKKFRIGGDEFAVIYAGTATQEYINGLINSFHHYIEQSNIDRPEHLKLSIAVGVAFRSSSINESVSNVFRRADRIMYDNKRTMKKNLNMASR